MKKKYTNPCVLGLVTIQDNLSNPFYFCIRHVTGCSTAGKPGEFLLLSSIGVQLRTTICNWITYYMCFFILFSVTNWVVSLIKHSSGWTFLQRFLLFFRQCFILLSHVHLKACHLKSFCASGSRNQMKVKNAFIPHRVLSHTTLTELL